MTAASHILHPFMVAGVFTSAEAQLVDTIARLEPAADRLSLLALAVAGRGVRLGHSCVDLGDVAELDALRVADDGSDQGQPSDLPWPDTDEWVASLGESPIVASPGSHLDEPVRPLVLDGDLIYLQRYYTHEIRVAENIISRAANAGRDSQLEAILDDLFGPDNNEANPQRQAAEAALTGGLTIITGGPGTGKTYTIARILAGANRLANEAGRSVAIALVAPTGKAAARITESISDVATDLAIPPIATTIHALLGWAPGDGFRHNRGNPLPHDLVIVDETSMISLSLIDSLLGAVRPDAAVVLVGDPDQLASVEVGTVLSDIVGSSAGLGPDSQLSDRIIRLTRVHRFGEDSAIGALAGAVKSGDVETTLKLLSGASQPTEGGAPTVGWVRPERPADMNRVIGEVVEASVSVAEAAIAGDAERAVAASLDTKVLAATRMSQYGLHHWSDLVESSVIGRVPGVDNSRRWFVGRPVMITANDRINRLANGDTGIVVAHRGGLALAMSSGGPGTIRYVPTSRLSEVESWWAMTIHKSQGSEFRHVVVSLPPTSSPILTRELLYTALTRARERVTIVATEASLQEAVGRTVSRASGLGARLWPDQGGAIS